MCTGSKAMMIRTLIQGLSNAALPMLDAALLVCHVRSVVCRACLYGTAVIGRDPLAVDEASGLY